VGCAQSCGLCQGVVCRVVLKAPAQQYIAGAQVFFDLSMFGPSGHHSRVDENQDK